MDRNSTNFPLANYEFLKSKKYTANDLISLNQFIVHEYLLGNPNLRGLLLFWDMGYGKTRGAVVNIKEYKSKYDILVIAPSKVFSKFRDEYSTLDILDENTKFISLKANNLSEQIEKLPTGDDLFAKPLDNKFIIIDEAHNFFNAIVNGSKNAVDLYDSIMAAKNIKLLFLSGTPIVNTPFELVPCYNMLVGEKLFPENQEDFEIAFIEKGYLKSKNMQIFKQRIFGLTSYGGDWIAAVQRVNRPKILETKYIKCYMTEEQYSIYSTYRDKEKEESSGIRRNRGAERFSPKNSSSSYRIRSRMASNLVPIDGKATLADIKNSPKFIEALKIVNYHIDKKQPGIVCSNFVHNCGLEDFAKLLDDSGWERWDYSKFTKTKPKAPINSGGVNNKYKKVYAIISGDQSEDEVRAIQHITYSKDNMYGEQIGLALIGPAGAEGIEFWNYRFSIIMDPFFNAIRIDQFEKRIDRIGSHEMLPLKERTIQPYRLETVIPESVYKTKSEQIEKLGPLEQLKAKQDLLSTDEYLYLQAKKRKILSLEFYKGMIESSIDCSVLRDKLPKERAKKINCLMCAPTNQPLYNDRLDKDLQSRSNCTSLESRQSNIKAKEIIVDDAKYFYTRDSINKKDIKIFEENKILNGWVPMLPSNPKYQDVLAAIS
jgi:hypothetical protein